MSTHPQHLYAFGPFRLDTAEKLLLRDGEPVPLTPKAFETLVTLVERSGHLVEKDELMKMIWSDAYVEESNLTNNVYALRKLLGSGENGRSYIETVPKRGYRFTAPVKELPAEALVVEKRTLTRVVTEETVTDGSPRQNFIGAGEAIERPFSHGEALTTTPDILSSKRKAWRWVVIALLGVTLGIAGFFIYRSLTAAPRGQIESLAVLPFKNESGDPDLEYLSEGVAESLINRLSQLPGVKVIARSSSFQYKSKDTNPQEVAEALGVEAVLTGRVLQRDDSLQISVELINARDRTQIWGEQYSRKAADVLAVQAEISREIAERLRSKLTVTGQQQFTRRETENPLAYELLLKGNFYRNKGGTENRKKSIEYYQQAIAIDGNYALAYAELAEGYAFVRGDPKVVMPKREAAARKALELNDNLAEAHFAMAALGRQSWKWQEAEREYQRTIELNPNLDRAHAGYSGLLSLLGRHDESIAAVQRARRLDPVGNIINTVVGRRFFHARRYDEAIEALKKTIELDQNYPDAHVELGNVYAAKGMYREAIAEYQLAEKLGDQGYDLQIHLGAAYTKIGERERAQAILKQLRSGQKYVSLARLAILHGSLDQREEAFASLEKAYAEREPQLQFLEVDPAFDRLRDDPRFQNLVSRVGLS